MNNLIYISNEFGLDNDELMLNETLFHNSNGYIGVRGNFEEGYPEGYASIRGQYINGFYDFVEMKQAEKLCGLTEEKQTILNVVDTQGIELDINGEKFSLFEGKVKKRTRKLYMKKGITTREIVWCSNKGDEVLISINRMTSFEILPLFLIEYSVTPVNFDGYVKIVSTHIGEVMNYSNPDDPRVAGEIDKYILPENPVVSEGISYITSKTSKSGLKICSAVKNKLSKQCTHKTDVKDNTVVETMNFDIKKNESVTLYKYTILCDSIRYDNPEKSAENTMKDVLEMSVDRLHEDQEKYLDNFWSNCALEVYGDDELSEAVSYNLYQLIQSVGKDKHSNITAKGLSGEGYEGHYFWDTEMYIQPFFTLTNREIARNLIHYRYTILEYAKENAKILGHKKGALYPWRTIMGKECSGYFPSGTAQYHINGDIAYSVISYYLVSKDLDMVKEYGAEILIETARLWMDVGNFYKGQFRINDVTGPDEYTCLVNNNYYTNVLAKHNLKWAVKFCEILEKNNSLQDIINKTGISSKELAEFKEAAEKMYLPYDEELKINPQDDSFLTKEVWDIENTPKENFPLLLHYHPLHLYRYQVCKQADTVLAHFILEDEQSLETISNSFDYYEKITTHDSSLSTCIFSIVAAKLGRKEKAYDYFGESSKLDLFNTHKNTKDGIHTANMGGTYMCIVYGFGGLRIKEDGLFISPVLPKQWNGYKFRILYEDSKIEVNVDKESCKITLLEGSKRELYVHGKKYTLDTSITVPVK